LELSRWNLAIMWKGRRQDVYVLRSYHLGREITAVLPCTLWAALPFEYNSQARVDVMLIWHRAIPTP